MYHLCMDMVNGCGYLLIPGFTALSLLLLHRFRPMGLYGMKAGRNGSRLGAGTTKTAAAQPVKR